MRALETTTDDAVPTRAPWRQAGLGLLIAALATAVAVVAWARNRGLDLTDEGYYLQSYAYPDATPADTTQFARLVDLVTGPAELDIPHYRLLGLACVLAAAAFFGFALDRFARARLPHLAPHLPAPAASVSFVALAGLLGYVWLPLTISYNTITAALVPLIGGLTLLFLARHEGGRFGWADGWRLAAAGALVPFLFYVRWPSAVTLSLVVAAFLTVALPRGHRRAPLVVFVAATAVSMVVVTEEVVAGLFSLEGLADGTVLTADDGTHDPATLVFFNIREALGGVVRAFRHDFLRLIALVFLFAGPALAGRLGGSDRLGRILRWVLPVLGGAYVLAEIWGAPYFDRSINFRFVVSVLVAMAISLVAVAWARSIRAWQVRRALSSPQAAVTVATMLFCLVLPFTVGAGTNVPFLRAALNSASGFGAFIVLASAAVAGISRDRVTSSIQTMTLAVVAVVFTAQIANGVVADPFRLPASLDEQTVAVEGIPRLDGMRLDPVAAGFVTDVYQLVTEETAFRPGDPILALSKIPGLVYLLDGTTPGTVWIDTPTPGNQHVACRALAREPDDVAATGLLLLNSAVTPEMDQCLRELWPAYPDALVEVGRVALPGEYGSGDGPGTDLVVLEVR